jgi:transcriptional regulator with PAS, ATPase and Fis domain
LVSRAIHALSIRSVGPFIDVNCAAITETLAERELFGAERGSYTGAQRTTEGFLALAHTGTLLLDEVCSMGPGIQAKLLRALELGEFWRVGGRARVRADFRTIATVSAPIEELMDAGRLRPDLAYRLQGYELLIPPLRERRTDIGDLARVFLAEAGGSARISPDAIRVLEACSWRGNVRQLRSVIRRVVASNGVHDITPVHLAPILPRAARAVGADRDWWSLVELHGSVSATARALGIPRSTLRSRLHAATRM